MNNFGVIELASAKTTSAPGWAYVPDRQPHHHLAASVTTTTNRKRARTTTGGTAATLSLADAGARQEAKARREIEALDRDNARDIQIPAKRGNGSGSGSGKTAGKKHTANVRKILQSQKTFANHLDDYTALSAQQEANPTSTSNPNNNAMPITAPETTTTATTTPGRRASHRPTASVSSLPSSSKKPALSNNNNNKKEDPPLLDTEMPDAPFQSPSTTTHTHTSPSSSATLIPAHESDTNPLLATRLPPIPTATELHALLSAPPLSYLGARATWSIVNNNNNNNEGGDEDGGQQQRRYPTRSFCAVCGYWGRVRCMKCGTRVCALECLETHRDECVSRYGL